MWSCLCINVYHIIHDTNAMWHLFDVALTCLVFYLFFCFLVFIHITFFSWIFLFVCLLACCYFHFLHFPFFSVFNMGLSHFRFFYCSFQFFVVVVVFVRPLCSVFYVSVDVCNTAVIQANGNLIMSPFSLTTAKLSYIFHYTSVVV